MLQQLIHVNYLTKNFLKLKFQIIKLKKKNKKGYWPKEHNNSSTFTKPYVFEEKLTKSAR